MDLDDLSNFSRFMYENFEGGAPPRETIDVSVVSYPKKPNEKPTITRPLMSIFEFVRVITELAKHIYNVKSLSDYVEDKNMNTIVYPCEIALKLLEEGKYDAKINRGYETVWFSDLRKNPQWTTIIEAYYRQQHDNAKQFLSAYGLV